MSTPGAGPKRPQGHFAPVPLPENVRIHSRHPLARLLLKLAATAAALAAIVALLAVAYRLYRGQAYRAERQTLVALLDPRNEAAPEARLDALEPFLQRHPFDYPTRAALAQLLDQNAFPDPELRARALRALESGLPYHPEIAEWRQRIVEDAIQRRAPAEAIPQLLKLATRPESEYPARKLLQTIDRLAPLAVAPLDQARLHHLLDNAAARWRDEPALLERFVNLSLRQGRVDSALQRVRRLLLRDADNALLVYWVARCHAARADGPMAVQEFNRAIELDPKLVPAHVALVETLVRLENNPEEAREALERMTRLNPDSPDARLAEGLFLAKFGGGDPEIAFREALQLDPKNPETHLAALFAAWNRDRAERARELAENALRLFPEDPRFHLAAVIDLLRQNRTRDADDALAAALARFPNRTDLRDALVQLEIRLGRLDEAESLVQQWPDLPHARADQAIARARILVARGREAEALLLLNANGLALDNPENPDDDTPARYRAAAAAAVPENAPESEKSDGASSGSGAGSNSNTPTAQNRNLDRAISREFHPAQRRRAALVHVRAYRALGDVRGEALAWTRVLDDQPGTPTPELQLVRLLVRNQQTDRALDRARRLVLENAVAQSLKAALALLKTAASNSPNREWLAALKEINDAETADPRAPLPLVLRARWSLLQANLANAARQLDLLRANHPDIPEGWVLGAVVAHRRGERPRFLQLVEQARVTITDPRERLDAEITAWACVDDPDSFEQLARALDAVDSLPPDDRPPLQVKALLALAAQAGNQRAMPLLRKTLDANPESLPLWIGTFPLLLEARDVPLLERFRNLARLREGETGEWWKIAETALLLARGRREPALNANNAAIEQQLRDLSRIEREPDLVLRLRAEHAVLRNRLDDAVQLYLDGIPVSANPQRLARELADLLVANEWSADLAAVFDKLETRAKLPDDLRRLAIDLALRAGDLAAAKRYSRNWIDPDDANPNDLLRLANVEALAGNLPAANELLKNAVRKAPDEPAPWIALVALNVRAANIDEAKRLAELAAKRPALPPLAAATCQALAGNLDDAEQFYRRARQAGSDDPRAILECAEFDLSLNRLEQARQLLRTALQIPQLDEQLRARARALLAAALAPDAQNSPEALREALALLDQNLDDPAAARADHRRLRAIIAANQPRERAESLRQLEAALLHVNPDPHDRYVQAKLLESLSEWPRAKSLYLALARDDDAHPETILAVGETFLEHRDIPSANFCLERARAILGQPTVLSERLRARILAASGRPAEALPIARAIAESNALPPEEAAALLEEAGRPDLAEPLFRAAVQTQNPASAFPLALHLARLGKLDDALRALEPAWKLAQTQTQTQTQTQGDGEAQTQPPQDPAPLAGAIAAVLWTAKPPPDHPALQTLLDRIENLLRDDPAPPSRNPLRIAVAQIHQARRDWDRAVETYQELLKLNPDDVVALNNLAHLHALAERPPGSAPPLLAGALDLNDPAALVQAAIDIQGPAPELLDTRALVLARLGQFEPAIQDARRVALQTPDPVALFHLAWIAHQAGALDEVPPILQRARQLGLDPQKHLHPLETPRLEILEEYAKLANKPR